MCKDLREGNYFLCHVQGRCPVIAGIGSNFNPYSLSMSWSMFSFVLVGVKSFGSNGLKPIECEHSSLCNLPKHVYLFENLLKITNENQAYFRKKFSFVYTFCTVFSGTCCNHVFNEFLFILHYTIFQDRCKQLYFGLLTGFPHVLYPISN